MSPPRLFRNPEMRYIQSRFCTSCQLYHSTSFENNRSPKVLKHILKNVYVLQKIHRKRVNLKITMADDFLTLVTHAFQACLIIDGVELHPNDYRPTDAYLVVNHQEEVYGCRRAVQWAMVGIFTDLAALLGNVEAYDEHIWKHFYKNKKLMDANSDLRESIEELAEALRMDPVSGNRFDSDEWEELFVDVVEKVRECLKLVGPPGEPNSEEEDADDEEDSDGKEGPDGEEESDVEMDEE